MLRCGPGAHQVQRPELCRAGATQGLAVDGYMLDLQSSTDGLLSVAEAGLVEVGVEAVVVGLEGGRRGDAVGQFQEATQPLEALASEGDVLGRTLGPDEERAQGDDDDVWQAVQAAVSS